MDRVEINTKDIDQISYSKKRSQQAKSAINKGKTGEKTIVDLLKKYSGMFWCRIPSSGARIGKSNRDKVNQMSENQIEAFLGDIFPPAELSHRFIIESKNYATFPFPKFERFLKGKDTIPAQLDGWINEFQYDTETYLMSKYKREPISFLFMKITGEGQWVVGNVAYFKQIFPDIQYPEETAYFDKDPFDVPKNKGYSNTWFFADAKEFVALNEKVLFV